MTLAVISCFCFLLEIVAVIDGTPPGRHEAHESPEIYPGEAEPVAIGSVRSEKFTDQLLSLSSEDQYLTKREAMSQFNAVFSFCHESR